MNTQILHGRMAESIDAAAAYKTDEVLRKADLLAITQNAYPINIIMQEGNSFAIYSPALIEMQNPSRVDLSCVQPEKSPAVRTIIAMDGATAMTSYHFTGLDPDIVYLVFDYGGGL